MNTLPWVLVVSCLCVQTVSSIKCYRCWPPSDEDTCKRSTDRMDCRDYRHLGYNSCIEVRYHGSKTLARTCYPSWKCDGAREWCRRYGPCTVKCCNRHMCNTSAKTVAVTVVPVLVPILLSLWQALGI